MSPAPAVSPGAAVPPDPAARACSVAAGAAACPLCGAASAPAFSTPDRNRGLSDEVFHYRRCTGCGAIHLENVPPDLSAFYPRDYFVRPGIDALRAEAAGFEGFRMRLVARHAGGGGRRLVEIGPGSGNFAIQALDAGFAVTAVEVDPSACRHLRETLGIEVVESGAPEAVLDRLGPVDAIVAWHVLEHLAKPWAVLEAAAAALASGGVLVLATPNPRAFGLRALGGRWPHVDAPRHLYLLPARAVIARAAAVGLEAVELTATDPGSLHWNAFAWHWLLRGPRSSPLRDGLARATGSLIARLLAPIERHGLRGAAYTLVLRKR